MKSALQYNNVLKTVNNINDVSLCLGVLSYFDYLITTPKGGPNLLLRSADLSDAAWIKTDVAVTAPAVVDPFGGSSSDLATDNSAAATGFVSQSVAISTDDEHVTASFFFKLETAPVIAVALRLTGGVPADSAVAIDVADLVFSRATAVGNSPAIIPTIVNCGDGWARVSLSLPNTGANNSATIEVYPSYAAALDGSGLSFDTAPDPTLQDGTYLTGFSLERSSVASIYTPTAATAVTDDAFADDTAVIKSLRDINPSLRVMLTVDLSVWSPYLVDQISRYYGSYCDYVYFENCDFSPTVDRALQNSAFAYARTKSFSVAYTAADPLDIWENIFHPTYNPNGQSLATFPGDVEVVKTVLQSGVWQARAPFMANELVRSRRARYRNVPRLMLGSTADVTGYNSLVRDRFADIANFFGYEGVGYSADPGYYDSAEKTVTVKLDGSVVTNGGPNLSWGYRDDTSVLRSDGKVMTIATTIDSATYT